MNVYAHALAATPQHREQVPQERQFTIVCLLGLLAEIYVMVCSLHRRNFRHELAINVYMSAAAAVTIGLLISTYRFGIASPTYVYYYYYTENRLPLR